MICRTIFVCHVNGIQQMCALTINVDSNLWNTYFFFCLHWQLATKEVHQSEKHISKSTNTRITTRIEGKKKINGNNGRGKKGIDYLSNCDCASKKKSAISWICWFLFLSRDWINDVKFWFFFSLFSVAFNSFCCLLVCFFFLLLLSCFPCFSESFVWYYITCGCSKICACGANVDAFE